MVEVVRLGLHPGKERPMARLEHVNLTVSDNESTANLLTALFGWSERWRGPAQNGGFTIHLGHEDGSGGDYVALYTPPGGGTPRHAKGKPLNHVGVIVDDLDAVEARAVAAGLEPFSHGDYHPGRRFYLFDRDGIEWEIVSYTQPAQSCV
jgi:catechol 2,3-dioxygenase-like lactoylglutathione lyase family enzyme